jgi:hypothetical protein
MVWLWSFISFAVVVETPAYAVTSSWKSRVDRGLGALEAAQISPGLLHGPKILRTYVEEARPENENSGLQASTTIAAKTNAFEISTTGVRIVRTYVDADKTNLTTHVIGNSNADVMLSDLKAEADVVLTYKGSTDHIESRYQDEAVVPKEADMRVTTGNRQVGHSQPAIIRTYASLPETKVSIAHFGNPPGAEPIYANGEAVGQDPRIISDATKSQAEAGLNLTNDAALDTMEPQNKAMLISVMVLNTVVAASLYLAARLQSRSTLVSKSGSVSQAQLANTSRTSANSQACDSTSTDDVTAASGTALTCCDMPGGCSGFESSLAWRDPSIDFHISDRSMEEWAQRRRSEALIRLGGCATITAAILFLEVSVGSYIGSLALISNGIHLVTDVAMYGGLFFAVRASAIEPHDRSYSFGKHRLEVVAVLIALVALYVMMGNIVFVAARRLQKPIAMSAHGGPAITMTATISLVVNSCLALWVGKSCNVHSHSHVHGGMATYMARMHLVIDAVQNGRPCLLVKHSMLLNRHCDPGWCTYLDRSSSSDCRHSMQLYLRSACGSKYTAFLPPAA